MADWRRLGIDPIARAIGQSIRNPQSAIRNVAIATASGLEALRLGA